MTTETDSNLDVSEEVAGKKDDKENPVQTTLHINELKTLEVPNINDKSTE